MQKKPIWPTRVIAGIETLTGAFDGLQIIDVYTPLTFRDWSASPAGSAYGVMRSTDQLMSAALLNRTALKGLYLAGQSVLAPGILGNHPGIFDHGAVYHWPQTVQTGGKGLIPSL